MDEGRKQRISDAFGAAAAHYEDHAGPQRFAAGLVADVAHRRHPGPVGRILEIGCGTGILTRAIRARWPEAAMVVTDLSPAMVARAAADGRGAGSYLAMDGECPPFEGACFDLILSSLTFQWFDDPGAAITRLAGLLRPGGSLIFSTMGRDSFAGWRGAHETCGLTSGVPDYPALDDLRAMLAGFDAAAAFGCPVMLEARGARALLAHLKGIGAVVPGSGRKPLSLRDLRRVMAAYDAAGGRDGYDLLVGRVTRAR